MNNKKIYLASLFTSLSINLTKSKNIKIKKKKDYQIEEPPVKIFDENEHILYGFKLTGDRCADIVFEMSLMARVPEEYSEYYKIVRQDGYIWLTNTVPVEVRGIYYAKEKTYVYIGPGRPIIKDAIKSK